MPVDGGWATAGAASASASEQVLEAVLLLTGAALDASCVAPLGKHAEHPLDVVQRRDRGHALGPGLKLAGRLRAAEQEHGEDRELLAAEAKCLLGQVAVLDGTAAVPACQPGQAIQAQALRRLADGGLVVGGDRIAIGRLVARKPQTVQGQRVLIGRGPALLDETPEHPLFGRRELGEMHEREHNRR